MECLQSWPEPVVRVQSLSESGITSIPEKYIKPILHRPIVNTTEFDPYVNIPVIDLQNIFSDDQTLRNDTLSRISSACRDWGFFQIVNHGVSHELMKNMREVWREFFKLPLEIKQEYANSPDTYEGYGSRLGVEKGAKLDWSDYFFLNFMPMNLRNPSNWPKLPTSCRLVCILLLLHDTNMHRPSAMLLLYPSNLLLKLFLTYITISMNIVFSIVNSDHKIYFQYPIYRSKNIHDIDQSSIQNTCNFQIVKDRLGYLRIYNLCSNFPKYFFYRFSFFGPSQSALHLEETREKNHSR